METNNILLRTDSYKFTHYLQLAKDTTSIFSYIESRGGKYESTVFFGLNYYLKKFLSQPITHKMIDEAKAIVSKHMLPSKTGRIPFNEEGFRYIVDKHGGRWPVRIRAVPEGTVLPGKNILMSIENTDPKCAWVTSFLETLLLKVWYPITVATTSYEIKKIIHKQLSETSDDLSGLPFKLHDFGYRGVSSEESAAIGGAAHLINFMGTDTVAGITMLMDYYKADVCGFSINATEHSTVTSWKRENEFNMYKNLVENVYKDEPIFACVSDSYNIYEAIKMWGKLKDQIVKNGQIVVVRPDSGDPVTMSLECMVLLDKEFGSTENKKGFKVLNNVRVIYGDGISSPKVIEDILLNARKSGFSAENFAFGMGGGLLQKCDRDTLKFAMKCSHTVNEFGPVDVYKEPITDPGKVSKRGRLDLIINSKGEYETVNIGLQEQHPVSVLQTVYENGQILIEPTLDQVRFRADIK